MEPIYMIFYTITVALLFNYFGEYITRVMLVINGHKVLIAEIVEFKVATVFGYNRPNAYRKYHLSKIKYRYNSKEWYILLFRDRDDYIGKEIDVLIYPKYGLVVRNTLRKTYFNDSKFAQMSNRFFVGIGITIALLIMGFCIWVTATKGGSMRFIIGYSIVIPIIGLLIIFWAVRWEQQEINRLR